ncbi:MAG TPA: YceI family protein [Phototrophicaceae bacterium]|nr:YceI family protein [Phototrophicaceae bacterium]
MATWKFDPAHTTVGFTARHMMVTTVRGQFAPPEGKLVFDPENPAASYVEATIDAKTLTSGVEQRDNHLRSADFLETEKYPTITFKSTKVEVKGENEGKVTGDLTIHGVTHPVTLNVEYLGALNSPFGDKRAGFSATTKINREDWGLTWNVAVEAGGVLVGKEIKLEIDVEAILVPETETAATASN